MASRRLARFTSLTARLASLTASHACNQSGGLAGIVAVTLAATLAVTLAAPLGAQGLVRDIDPRVLLTHEGSAPGRGATAAGLFLFPATDTLTGREVWATDGSAQRTRLVTDVLSGPRSSAPFEFTTVGAHVFFAAWTQDVGPQLWRSDGSDGGTYMVRPIVAADVLHAGPNLLTAVGTTLYFTANEAATGRELWRSDGTAAGTRLVADMTSGPADTPIAGLVACNGQLLFAASTPQSGMELWRSDGTTTGTNLVADIAPGQASGLASPWTGGAVLGGRLLFAADDGVHGQELWTSDGTAAGTRMLRDCLPGNVASAPRGMVRLGAAVFFGTADGGLWRSDGTSAGTVRVTTLNAGVRAMFATASHVFALAAPLPPAPGSLWSSDGSAAGTLRLLDGLPLGGAGDAGGFATAQALYFVRRGTAPGGGDQLWRSDGSAAGTWALAAIAGPTSICGALGDDVFFAGTDPVHGDELWRANGTGATLVRDLRSLVPASGAPAELAAFDGEAWFAATDEHAGRELWSSDGTAQGTRLRVDLHGPGDGDPRELLPHGTRLLLVAEDPLGSDVWSSDGSAQGTLRLGLPTTYFDPRALAQAGPYVFFGAASHSGGSLWRTDGTRGGTLLLADEWPSELVAAGARVFFFSPFTTGLWTSDGSKAGTRLVAPFTRVQELAALGDEVCFAAFDPVHGIEPWCSNGTVAGTRLLRDVAPGTLGSEPRQLVRLGGLLFFTADDGVHGEELWCTDGSPAGTHLVRDVRPGARGARPHALVTAGTRLWFFADDGVHGNELWTSDGTAAGTVLVHDTWPGPVGGGGPVPGRIAPAGDGTRVVFVADDGVHGREPWVSDGTAAGTRLVADLVPGRGSADPDNFVRAGSRLYWSGLDTRGRELWAAPLSSLDATLAEPFGRSCFGAYGDPRIGTIGLPVLGNRSFAVTLHNARPHAAAALLFGAARGRTPIAGCMLHPAPPVQALAVLVGADGRATLPLPLPPYRPTGPRLAGAEAFLQWLVRDQQGALAGFAATSDGLHLVIGR